MAVHAGVFRSASAGDGSLESGGLPDDEVRGDATVGPATHAQFFGVGDSLLDGVIDHCHIVLIVLITPICPNGFAEILPVAGRTARIRKQNGIAVGSEELRQMGEFGVIGPDWPTVRTKDGRVPLPSDEVERPVEVPRNFRPVFTFEVHVFGLGQLQLGQ